VSVRIVALGSPHAGDDAAALLAAEGLAGAVLAGRPGAGLLDLLEGDAPTVLVDVVRGPAGRLVTCPLVELPEAVHVASPLSSHGFGAGEALRLARVLGRALPPGTFVGIGGERFGVGEAPSPAVTAALGALRDAIVAAANELEATCTRAG
jgi:hydrogenase maturation protease